MQQEECRFPLNGSSRAGFQAAWDDQKGLGCRILRRAILSGDHSTAPYTNTRSCFKRFSRERGAASVLRGFGAR